MRSEELKAAAAAVFREFEGAWNYDGRDLHKPSADEMLRQIVDRQPEAHRERLAREFFGDGPLTEALALPGLQEIVVLGGREIWVEAGGRLTRLGDGFLTERTFKNFIDRLCAEAGLRVDLSQPFADGRWRGFRVHLGCAPLTHCDFHLCLRRFPENPWTLARLEEAGWATGAQLATLRGLVSARQNLLFLGPTGSGKTTALGAALAELPATERVVIVEDTDELRRPNAASSKLLSRPRLGPDLGEVTLADLVRQSLRMRPSRLVMGEVRGPEAKDLLLALATGHAGSMGTLHATDAKQALLRLEMLVQLGAPQWSVETVRQLMRLSVDALVVCENESGHRRLQGIYRVAALESFGFLLEPVA